MKKKIATVLVFLFSCLCVLTGCNLFTSDNAAGLNSIVASYGDVSITREQLINAYNSSGYYYDNYYGKTKEEAMKLTIKDLINRQYFLNYINEQSEINNDLKLTNSEIYSVIKETWEYIDSSIDSLASALKKEMGLNVVDSETEEESSSEEETFSGYSPYQSTFYFDDETNKIYKINNNSESYAPVITDELKYQYKGCTNFSEIYKKLNIAEASNDFKKIVWNRYISYLKQSQASSLTASDSKSDEATFRRQVLNIYKSNLENAQIQKYEDVYKASYGLEYDEVSKKYYINQKTLQDMIDYYTKIYNQNKESYNISKQLQNEDDESLSYYTSLTKNRENYLYYGDDENLYTCIHILVKLSENQLNAISSVEDDNFIQENEKKILINNIKSQSNTIASERDFETGELIEDGTSLSVEELYSKLISDINDISYNEGSQEYLNAVTEVFNKYIYKYGQDTGIMNAQFDYVVGSKTSQMVKSFTEVVNELYKDGVISTEYKEITAQYDSNVKLIFPYGVGYAGAISAPFLQESDNYSGYHIVLLTGKLENLEPESLTSSNIYSKLSKKYTSISYNQNMFEYLYSKVASDTYSVKQTNIINSFAISPVYDISNFSDLY